MLLTTKILAECAGTDWSVRRTAGMKTSQRAAAAVAAASVNLLRNSIQAKAQNHESAMRDEVFDVTGGAAVTCHQPGAPGVGGRRSSSSSSQPPRSHPKPRHRARKLPSSVLDYSRWTRRTESRVFLPILSSSASSSFEDLRLADDEAASAAAGAPLLPLAPTTGSAVAPRGGDGLPPVVSALAATTRDERRPGWPTAEVTTTTTTTAAAAAGSQQAKVPLPPPATDNDEELAEEERVEMAIKAVKRLEGSLLREIHEIKERHKTLEALTLTRARAAKNESGAAEAGAKKRARAAAAAGAAPAAALRLHKPSELALQRQLPPKQTQLREKTLDPSPLLRGSFKPENAVLPTPGVAWTIRSLSPSSASKRSHGAWKAPPPVSAKTGKRLFQQWNDLDLGSAYFLPPSVTEAKTPIEAALRLQKVLTELSLFNHANNNAALVGGNI